MKIAEFCTGHKFGASDCIPRPRSISGNLFFGFPGFNLFLTIAVVVLGALATACALTTDDFVSEEQSGTGFCLFANNLAASIVTDTNDWPGVQRAAADLRADFKRVSGLEPKIIGDGATSGTNVIIVGTIGRSDLIGQLVRERKIDVSKIAGKWESFLIQTVRDPMPGVKNALVICGSDKRGTIYGVYDLSEQMGVSPWHFFADVPSKHHDKLFVKAGKYVQGPPAVKYRGIFINDEAPDLTGWVKERYGDYNHGFYTNVFELLLRLRANYLWPAMWNNCFSEDDPLNYKLADEYGIVMGTSHVEPMMRADKEWDRAGYTAREWNFQTHSNELMKFWREGIERNKNCENIITIAMRGKVDTAMSPTANVALLEEIVAAQRNLIADVYHTNASDVPQLWALYKEVQEYYEKGMRVPDDVTLLWCDDNWGDLRRVPPPEDRHRAGGSGIYYHLDYVGSPRNYKWVNSVSIPRIWEQMSIAHACGANQIWIANVGHLQHVQIPAEFFLTFAWNPDAWPKEKMSKYTQLWAARDFGSQFASPIADIVARFTQFNARRKPELLSPNTFSIVNYQEADRVLADWDAIAKQAEDISQKLPPDSRDAFSELVLYPVKACANLNGLYIAAAKNHLYATQGRADANEFAQEVKDRFEADATFSDNYNHSLANGKWNHMMDQTHIGYTRWQQPETNNIPPVTDVQLPDQAGMGIAIEGATNVWPDSSSEPVLDFDEFGQPTRYVDVFNRGKDPFNFSAVANASCIRLSMNHGKILRGQRIFVSIDWDRAPVGVASGLVSVGDATNSVSIKVNIFSPQKPPRRSFHGFVEADGYVSIDAEHFTHKVDGRDAKWEKVDGLGNSSSAMTIFPVTAASATPPKNSPCLEYRMYLFNAGKVDVECRIAPTLNFIAGRGLRYAISFDDQPPQIVTAVPADYSVGSGDFNRDWGMTVSDNIRKVKTAFNLATPGEHTLKFWMVDPGVVLEKIIVNCGGVKSSYFGPLESFHR